MKPDQLTQDLAMIARNAIDYIRELERERDALLEALRSLLSYANVLEMRLLDADGEHRAMRQARAAIARAEGETNGQA